MKGNGRERWERGSPRPVDCCGQPGGRVAQDNTAPLYTRQVWLQGPEVCLVGFERALVLRKCEMAACRNIRLRPQDIPSHSALAALRLGCTAISEPYSQKPKPRLKNARPTWSCSSNRPEVSSRRCCKPDHLNACVTHTPVSRSRSKVQQSKKVIPNTLPKESSDRRPMLGPRPHAGYYRLRLDEFGRCMSSAITENLQGYSFLLTGSSIASCKIVFLVTQFCGSASPSPRDGNWPGGVGPSSTWYSAH